MTHYAFLILLSLFECEKGGFSPLGATPKVPIAHQFDSGYTIIGAAGRVRTFPTVELGCTHTHQGVLKPER